MWVSVSSADSCANSDDKRVEQEGAEETESGVIRFLWVLACRGVTRPRPFGGRIRFEGAREARPYRRNTDVSGSRGIGVGLRALRGLLCKLGRLAG